MKKNIFLWTAAGLLALLFAYTGISKLADYTRFVRMLGHSPYVFVNPWVLGWALPLTEIVVAVLLLVPRTRFYALYASFVLMLVFTTYVAFMMAFSPHLPCSCGGVIQALGWKNHLYFNIFFTLLAATALVLQKRQYISAEKTGRSRTPDKIVGSHS